MRKTTLAALFLLFAVPIVAATTDAHNNYCSARLLGLEQTCTFSCHAGDTLSVTIYTGIAGSAACGGAAATCTTYLTSTSCRGTSPNPALYDDNSGVCAANIAIQIDCNSG